MADINIGKIISRKRKEKGITQEVLADFIGVSKASVSKWETGHSYPDIFFLPQLAAYFNISLDDLMGYEPQLSEKDIRKIYTELLADFSELTFDEAKDKCQYYMKKYYSCFPLIYQIGILLLSYGSNIKNEIQKKEAIEEAKELFIRVKNLCGNIELKQLALQSEAICESALENAEKVITLLESERSYCYHPSIAALLGQSYQMIGKIHEAKITIQDSIIDSVISLVYDLSYYLSLNTDDKEHFEEGCNRLLELEKIFNISRIFPLAIVTFYIIAAEGYMKMGEEEKALSILELYVILLRGKIFPLKLRGDHFFRLVEEIIKKQLDDLPYAMPQLSLDNQSIKEGLITIVVNNPIYDNLSENQRFINIVKKLKEINRIQYDKRK